MTTHTLTESEMYAIGRATSGLPWKELSTGPLVKVILDNLELKDSLNLLRLLGPELSTQILKLDPYVLPTLTSPLEPEPVVIPALPKEAMLSDEALAAAEKTGTWLNDALRWASRRSPMTPSSFLTAGLIWAIGLAIARRCAAPLHKPIYPHLYVLWVAPTSIFKKTTGMDAISDLVNAAMPHMLLPEESTPEAFVSALGAKHPLNYDSFSAYEKKLEDKGQLYAAQRGLLIDEASSLFGASKKDYMQGHTEMIMRLYDAPQRYTRSLRSEGKIVIQNASLCILGATTPASLIRNTSSQSWETGELARFVLLYPEHEMAYDLGSSLADYAPPSALVNRLASLHSRLPAPIEPTVGSDDEQEQPTAEETLLVLVDKDAYAAYAAYTKAVTYDLLRSDHKPDARLHPNYARLHIQAMKIALSLAAMDWADESRISNDTLPRITLGHWARAQQITETWRTSFHHVIDALNRGDDSLTETRILDLLSLFPEGRTLRELTQRTGLRRKAIEEALKALHEAGLVFVDQRRRGDRGPEASIFCMVR